MAKRSKCIRDVDGAIAAGKTLPEAADALIVETADHDAVRAAVEPVLERQL
jgi:predicted dinucleotide-utilizing enzyme